MRYLLALWLALLAFDAHAVEPPTVSVHGTVCSPDDKPLTGVPVVLRASILTAQNMIGSDASLDVLARTKTDENGSYQFQNIEVPLRMFQLIDRLNGARGYKDAALEVIALSPEHAIAWQEVPLPLGAAPVPLVLREPAKVTGIVRDREGKPVRQAWIGVWGLTPQRRQLDTHMFSPGDQRLSLSEIKLETFSDDEGKFQLLNLPVDYRIACQVRAPNLKQQVFYLDTAPEAGDATVTLSSREENRPLLRFPLELTLAPQRSLEVRVIDDAGKPVTEGGLLGWFGKKMSWHLPVVVDKAGRAHVPVTDTGKFTVVYAANPLRPRLGGYVQLDVAPDNELAPVTIQLPPFRWLEGSLVDESSGRGLPGVVVMARADSQQQPPLSWMSSSAITQEKGRFRIPVASGIHTLSTIGGYYGYYAAYYDEVPPPTTSVEIKAGEEFPKVVLKLHRGLVVRGVVRNSAKEPVANVLVVGTNLGSPHLTRLTRTDQNGEYVLAGFSPRNELLVMTMSDAGAAQVVVPADDEASLTTERSVSQDLNLNAGVTLVGEVTKEGKPAPKVLLNVLRSIGRDANRFFHIGTVVTDDEGKYRIPGFEPGAAFRLEFDASDKWDVIKWRYRDDYRSFVEKGPEMNLQRAELVAFRQILAGVVVDPEGKPVAGAQVSANWADGRSMSSRGERQPWTASGPDGKFELVDLPEQPLQLVAYMPQPGGGLIRFATRISPRLNQTDVRIVLDPKLTKDVEDLDKPK